jgi:hypothetical protein
VLHAVGGLDDADEEVPSFRIDPVQDDLRAVVEGAIEVLHELLLVQAIFVERPGGLRPAERPVGPEPLVQIGGKRFGKRHCRRRIVRLPVHGRDIELQIVIGLDQEQLRHPVHAHQEIDAELQLHPAAPLPLRQVNVLPRDVDIRRPGVPVPGNRERQAHVLARLQLRHLRPVVVGESPLGAQLADLLSHDRVWWTHELTTRRVAFEDQTPQDAAELRVAFFVPAQVGCKVVERAHRSSDVRQRQAGEQLAVGYLLGRERHGHGENAASHATPPRGDPERRAAAQ